MTTYMKNGKVYIVISGKGGVGKTTSAVNLGTSINSLGKEVIIADVNLTTPNLGLHLGSPIVPVTLNHVMVNKARAEDAIYEHESGTKILPASLSMPSPKSINLNRLQDITKRLRKIADYIILDSAAGLGEEAKAAIKSSDEVIIITNPEISAVTGALKTIKLSHEMGKKILGAIITRYQNDPLEMSLESIKDMLEIPILGIVPEDRAIKESQHVKNAVIYTHPKSKSSKAYQKIARRILGPEFMKGAEKVEKNTAGFFKRLWRNIAGKR